MTVFLNCEYYCQYCRIRYNNRGDHNCDHMYKGFLRYDYSCKIEDIAICSDCKAETRNLTCRNLHNYGTCFKQRVCEKCTHLKSKTGPHICLDERWWPNCENSVNYDHMCFINKTKKIKYNGKFHGFAWFDIETFVNSQNFHEANLIMVKRRCEDCLNSVINSLCQFCDQKYSFPIMEDFVDWCK